MLSLAIVGSNNIRAGQIGVKGNRGETKKGPERIAPGRQPSRLPAASFSTTES